MSADQQQRPVPEEILDATCGGRSIWLPGQKHHDNALYIDKREEEPGFTGQEGRTFSVEPDEIQDFRDLPYRDEEFRLVVFDPPHLMREDGMENLTGYITKSYGALHAETWQADLEAGFEELWRVLKPGGTLVFKFADNAVDFKDVLELAPRDPLFGTTTKKSSNCENRWFVFYKPERNARSVGTDTDRIGPAAGSKICSECGYAYFSEWGHDKTCSRHPQSDRDD